MNSSTPSQFREDFVVLKHNFEGGSSILLQVETCLWQGPKFWVQPSVIFEAVQHRSRKWLQWLTNVFLSVDFNPTHMHPLLRDSKYLVPIIFKNRSQGWFLHPRNQIFYNAVFHQKSNKYDVVSLPVGLVGQKNCPPREILT